MTFLTVKQVAEMLQMSESGVYKYIRLKKIPYYKLGQNIRFSKEELEEWMKNRHVPSQTASTDVGEEINV